MKLDFEQTVIMNPALGAATLFVFCSAYFGRAKHTLGPTLPEVMLVLPITFHARTAASIWRKQADSGLARAVLDFPELSAGLQVRMEAFALLSTNSLAVATSTGLLEVDPDSPWPRYHPARRTLPSALVGSVDDTKRIHGAARRLGWWLAEETLNSTASLLRVRF